MFGWVFNLWARKAGLLYESLDQWGRRRLSLYYKDGKQFMVARDIHAAHYDKLHDTLSYYPKGHSYRYTFDGFAGLTEDWWPDENILPRDAIQATDYEDAIRILSSDKNPFN